VAPAWQIWMLAAAAPLQLAVAYWWFRGPRLEGTRYWVSGLFALNGLATATEATNLLMAEPLGFVKGVGRVSSIWTNFALFGLGLVALRLHERRRTAYLAIVGVFGLSLAVASPFEYMRRAFENTAFTDSIQRQSLSYAIFAGAAGLAYRAGEAEQPRRSLWVLALAGIVFRFAELSIAFNSPPSVDWNPAAPLETYESVMRPLWLVATVGAFGSMLVHRSRGAAVDRPNLYDGAILLFLGGFIFGAGRGAGQIGSLVAFFSLGFVRPLVFLGVQNQLLDGSFRGTGRWRALRSGGIVFVWVLVGLPVGYLMELTSLSSFLIGLGLGVLAISGLHISARLQAHPQEHGSERGEQDTAPEEPDWPLEPDRVALPDDWKQQIQTGYETYYDLPAQARDNVDELARWQCIVLALWAAPDGDEIPPYERTTPGLHFLTHCPYSSIGPEIARTNDRAEAIVDELDLARPKAASLHGDEPLIESSLGQAEGLSSPRAKSYELTELGDLVAEALRDQVGLAESDDEQILLVLGEGYADA